MSDKELSKYYTNKTEAKICFEHFLNNINYDKDDLIIEPSAGNGSFIELIKSKYNNYKFYDIKPEQDEIIQQDYLQLDVNKLLEHKKKYNKLIHVIGNPPFGKYNKGARNFIKQSQKYADTISFILPSSFKKLSLQNSFHKYFHLIYQYELPYNSFIFQNESYNVNCIFQIWVKKNVERQRPTKLKENNFRFVKKSEKYREISDIAFTRARASAGKISFDIENASKEYCNFIKFSDKVKTNKDYNKLIDELKQIKWIKNNTSTSQHSICQQDIIKRFNPIIEKYIN